MSAAIALPLALLLALSISLFLSANAWASESEDQSELYEQMQRDGIQNLDDMGEGIPPVLVDGSQNLDPHQLEPIDPSSIEITSVTPADRFIRATTPLLVGLSLGALGLLGFAISQAVRKRSVAEIRLGE